MGGRCKRPGDAEKNYRWVMLGGEWYRFKKGMRGVVEEMLRIGLLFAVGALNNEEGGVVKGERES